MIAGSGFASAIDVVFPVLSKGRKKWARLVWLIGIVACCSIGRGWSAGRFDSVHSGRRLRVVPSPSWCVPKPVVSMVNVLPAGTVPASAFGTSNLNAPADQSRSEC